METKIIFNGVNKYYGKKHALKDVNLTIENGMFGLLGRNGAGKTTLMKLVATLIQRNSGEISVCGYDINDVNSVRRIIGYLPQEFSMYGNMTVYEAMDYLGILSGMRKEDRRNRTIELLKKVNLIANKNTKVRALSGGMKRRLGIAQAILHNPKVLIVDEPTAGLDPEERVRFRNLLSELAENRVVILSTHIASDIEASCEKMAVLDNGEVVYDGSVVDFLRMADGKIYMVNISKIEFEMIKKKYTIISAVTNTKGLSVKFIAEEGNDDIIKSSEKSQINIEDAYMYLMHKRGGEISCL